MPGFFRTLFLVIIAVCVTVFVIINRDETTLYFSPLHDPITTPLYFILVATLGIGLILGILMLSPKYLGLKLQNRKLKKEKEKLEKNIEKAAKTLHEKEAIDLVPVLVSPSEKEKII